ncbi:MAG: hypothetical protein ACFE0J_16120 [Elainellaceae cyanobacterium]
MNVDRRLNALVECLLRLTEIFQEGQRESDYAMVKDQSQRTITQLINAMPRHAKTAANILKQPPTY